MHYLTVQDVLWIHLQIAKKPVKFDYAKLEEGVNYQYAYGKSKDVVSQAARLFSGFPTMSPFVSGNRAVTLASGITFLALNGYELNVNVKDLGEWFSKASNPAEAKIAIEMAIKKGGQDHHATPRETAGQVLARYQSAIAKLAD